MNAKRILITGANSYIGQSFERWATQHYSEHFQIDTVDVIDSGWKEKNFSKYDIIFHVAGIVHCKEKPEMKALYQTVNIELPISIAKKAKVEGVRQFVFMSSMSIYGKNVGRISRDEVPLPKNYYGKSKWKAEQLLEKLSDENFKIAILRPPMVYGEGCKGNYQLLKKFAQKSPIFPDYKNERSLIHIDILCDTLCEVMREGKEGLFFPQNSQYICTTELVKEIAKENHKKIILTRAFNPFITVGIKLHVPILEKTFGSLIYEKEI